MSKGFFNSQVYGTRSWVSCSCALILMAFFFTLCPPVMAFPAPSLPESPAGRRGDLL